MSLVYVHALPNSKENNPILKPACKIAPKLQSACIVSLNQVMERSECP